MNCKKYTDLRRNMINIYTNGKSNKKTLQCVR